MEKNFVCGITEHDEKMGWICPLLNPCSIIKLLESILNWLCLYIVLALMWIGAEYAFEGAVHSSHVDSVVNGLLAYYILRYEPKGGSYHG